MTDWELNMTGEAFNMTGNICLDYARHNRKTTGMQDGLRITPFDPGAQLPVNQEITTYACVLWGADI